MIDFKNMSGLTFDQIDFQPVDTSPMGPPVEDEWHQSDDDERYDVEIFMDEFLKLTGINPEAVHAFRFYMKTRRSEPQFLGFNYLDNFQVQTVRFQPSENFDQWIKGFSKGKETTVMFRKSKYPQGGLELGYGSPRFLELESNPAKFIKSHAPQYYFAEEHEAERKAFLDGFQITDSMKQTVDTDETRRLWDFILDRTGTRREGATQAQFDAFRQLTGYPLPQELQAIYAISDGAERAIRGADLLPLSMVMKHWSDWKKIFDDWTLSELKGNNESQDDLTIGMYTNPQWIPLVEKYQAHYIGMDLMPGPKGKIGQIIHFGRDQDLIIREAENINRLFAECMVYLTAPKQ